MVWHWLPLLALHGYKTGAVHKQVQSGENLTAVEDQYSHL